jgi:hypothetical protein
MPNINSLDKNLARAASHFVDAAHRLHPGIRITPIPPIEDEDFTFEVAVPPYESLDEVLEACHRVCIAIEDKYHLFFLPHVVHEPEEREWKEQAELET